MKHVKLLDISVSVVDQPELLAGIEALVVSGRGGLVNNVNIHACNLAVENPAFRDVLNKSEIVFCDGFGVKLGAWLQGKKLGQRMTPPDWIDALFSLCETKGYSLYFVGDEQTVVEAFSAEVQRRYPTLKLAGFRNGFFELGGAEDEQLVEDIRQSEADIVITGMGMPRQELWAWAARQKLNKGVFIATGALFRWYIGHEKRAPKWITGCGLEWLARLVMKPRQHFRRYVIGIPLFFWRVLLRRSL